MPRQRRARPAPPNALSSRERELILAVLNSPRFCDKSVAQAWATLLDDGVYRASISTMHRVLRGRAVPRAAPTGHPPSAREAGAARHRARAGVELEWNITKLRGPDRGVYYDLYVVLDS